MFFTNAGRMVAWLLLTLGLIRLGIAAYLGVLEDAGRPPPEIADLMSFQTQEQAVLMAAVAIGFALILGVLTEISRSFIRR